MPLRTEDESVSRTRLHLDTPERLSLGDRSADDVRSEALFGRLGIDPDTVPAPPPEKALGILEVESVATGAQTGAQRPASA